MKIYYAIFLAILTFPLQAQITLTSSNNMEPGTALSLYRGSTSGDVSEGPAGANVTWDFSDATVSEFLEITILAANAAPGGQSFPNATIALAEDGGYTFYKITPSAQAFNGVGSDFGSIVNYSDPQDLIRYPMTYQDSFSDDFSGTFTNFTRTGSSAVVCDAYGTVITPVGTFQNVLRIKTTMNYGDYNGGVPIATYDEVRYWWINASSGLPVFNITRLPSNSTNPIVTYFDDGVSSVHQASQINDFQVNPNPASDYLQVGFELAKEANVRIQLVNIVGQEVRAIRKEMSIGHVSEMLYMEDLTAGIYILNVVSGREIIASEKIQVFQ